MMCTDVNNDGKVDYMEFTVRFFNVHGLLMNYEPKYFTDKYKTLNR